MVCGQNFYPRSPCGERLTNANSPKSDNIISIHALLAESDTASSILMVAPSNFYPRSPCGERLGRLMLVMALSDFYPRSPCGERPVTIWLGYVYLDFYPRSPCGERRGDMVFQISINDFYPRSPCGERRERRKGYHPPLQFLSTLSLRRATGARLAEKISKCISIHALLAESDPIRSCCSALALIFLSTLSLRRATLWSSSRASTWAFLSTLSLRRATPRQHTLCSHLGISIHALLAESDS